MNYCTDNAAMIGAAGYFQYQKYGTEDDLLINGHSRLALERSE
jgi:N6-L-threonylcarbamoyladenine synthase